MLCVCVHSTPHEIPFSSTCSSNQASKLHSHPPTAHYCSRCGTDGMCIWSCRPCMCACVSSPGQFNVTFSQVFYGIDMCCKLSANAVCVQERESKTVSTHGHNSSGWRRGWTYGKLPRYHLSCTVNVFSGLQSRQCEHTFHKNEHGHNYEQMYSLITCLDEREKINTLGTSCAFWSDRTNKT